MNNLYSDISSDDEEEERIQETIYSDISSDIEPIDNNELLNMVDTTEQIEMLEEIEAVEPLIMAAIIEDNVVEADETRLEVEDNEADLMIEDIEAIVQFEIFETNESNRSIETIDQVLIEEDEIKKEISIIEISSSSSGGEEFEVDSVVAQRQGKTEIEYLIHFKGILCLYFKLF
jgi:hypothetical protein